jgi:hypothetical protein
VAEPRETLTDPIFELWLQRRGITPDVGNDDEDDGSQDAVAGI